MRHLALATVLALAAPALAAAQAFDADPTARVTVDPHGVRAGGGSEAPPAPDPAVRRSVRQGVAGGGGGSNAAPVNQGPPAGVVNEIPRRPVSNEGNPR